MAMAFWGILSFIFFCNGLIQRLGINSCNLGHSWSSAWRRFGGASTYFPGRRDTAAIVLVHQFWVEAFEDSRSTRRTGRHNEVGGHARYSIQPATL